MKIKYKLKKEDWDDKNACMDEAERLGYPRRIGYHAWFIGQGADGYDSILSFFDDIKELIEKVKKLTK